MVIGSKQGWKLGASPLPTFNLRVHFFVLLRSSWAFLNASSIAFFCAAAPPIPIAVWIAAPANHQTPVQIDGQQQNSNTTAAMMRIRFLLLFLGSPLPLPFFLGVSSSSSSPSPSAASPSSSSADLPFFLGVSSSSSPSPPAASSSSSSGSRTGFFSSSSAWTTNASWHFGHLTFLPGATGA